MNIYKHINKIYIHFALISIIATLVFTENIFIFISVAIIAGLFKTRGYLKKWISYFAIALISTIISFYIINTESIIIEKVASITQLGKLPFIAITMFVTSFTFSIFAYTTNYLIFSRNKKKAYY